MIEKIVKVPSFLIFQFKKRFLKISHQRKNLNRVEAKWELINTNLPNSPGSLFDIGCNEGLFSVNASQQGWFVWGIDFHNNAISYAVKNAEREGVENAFFSSGKITPENVKQLPEFDVIFLLSIFQEICSQYGLKKGYEIFDDLLKICRKALFFEPSSINRKYGQGNKVFEVDNDLESIKKWANFLVSRSQGWKARYIGKTEYTSNEPYRFMFLIERDK